MDHEVRILQKDYLNHDVIRFRLERPENYSFNSGQAIELTLNDGDRKGPAPFTFTGLNASPYLELMTKIYPAHQGLTLALSRKKMGDTVVIGDPWDSFINKGPGVFIAGGAGITPFIAILRDLKVKGNTGNSHLFFFNKTKDDVFLEDELREILGNNFISVITRVENTPRENRLDEVLFKKHVDTLQQPFYVCGPPGFMDTIQGALSRLGAVDEMVNVSF